MEQYIIEQNKQRFAILATLYQESKGESQVSIDAEILLQKLNIEKEEFTKALNFLQNERLIKVVGTIYTGWLYSIEITHTGILEVEQAFSKPTESTHHFPSQVFNNTFYNSQVNDLQQAGTVSSLNLEQVKGALNNMTNDPGRIYQNVSSGNMYGGMQAMQGNNNQPTMETHTVTSDGEQLNKEDVIQMLAHIEELVTKHPELSEAEKQQSLQYLRAAKVEANEPEPDKEFLCKSLQKGTRLLEATNDASESAKTLWETTKPILSKLAFWLGTSIF